MDPSKVVIDEPREMRYRSDLPPDMGERHIISTNSGPVCVYVSDQDDTKPPLITIHECGLNHAQDFQAFFAYPSMATLINQFRVFHIDLPGQEYNSPDLEQYPSMEEMGEQIASLIIHFGIQDTPFVGIGVGLGGYVLLSHAIKHPRTIRGLVLFGTSCEAASWSEYFWVQSLRVLMKGSSWMNQSRNFFGVSDADTSKAPDFVTSQFCEKFFSWFTCEFNRDLTQMFANFIHSRNSTNLMHLLSASVARSDLSDLIKDKLDDTSVLIFCGEESDGEEQTVHLLSCFSPSRSSWIKVPRCGHLVFEENPQAVVKPIELFFAGLLL